MGSRPPEDHPLFIGNMAASTRDDDPKNWVGGDGGPLIVLQSSAAAQWQGALGSEDDLGDDDSEIIEIDAGTAHLYAPGEVAFQSDSDAAFLCGDHITRRYGRDMLVLMDSEWSGRLFTLPSGAVGVVQVQCMVENLPEVVKQAVQAGPERSGLFQMQDESLRLLVGADTGSGEGYGYSEVPVTAGVKRWGLHSFEYGWAYVLSDDGPVIAEQP